MISRKRTFRGKRLGRGGFTVVELAVSLATTSVLLAMGYGAFRQYAEAVTARKASLQFASDVGLTRSIAIQRRASISLVADVANLDYEIRDQAGTVLMRRDFGPTSDLPLSRMKVSTAGDSLTFNSRGLLINGRAEAVLGRRGRTHLVEINALGRTTVD
jgi:Tfp pilus assembly protein FimT